MSQYQQASCCWRRVTTVSMPHLQVNLAACTLPTHQVSVILLAQVSGQNPHTKHMLGDLTASAFSTSVTCHHMNALLYTISIHAHNPASSTIPILYWLCCWLVRSSSHFLFVTALKSTVLLLRPCWATAPRLCHVTVHVHACSCAIYHATVAIITDKHRAYGYQQLLAKYAYTVCVRVPILNLLVTSWTMASVTAICLQKSFRSFHGASSSSDF